ncbi:hypothetical protein MRQ36_27030 [Micromonospora sp. R77]|uniref:hypothetical protein n=1 Tax=Micromonospora sp. R77 TaxID=2925836 RepID=UPI001F6104AA|nr:hypothetical protein [Micromonospora sp. R77]MCI4066004.1 hypothetical protein [Micromonospora sp. R77]
MSLMTVPRSTGRPMRQPARIWLVVTGSIAAGGILSGILLLLAPAGSLGEGFAPGEPVTVQLQPSSPQMVWAKEGPDGFPQVQCEPESQDVLASMTQEAPLFDVYELTVDGERWRGVLALTASPADTYQLACQAAGTSTSPLSIGDAPWSYGFRHSGLFRMATLGTPVSDTAIASVLLVLGTVVGMLTAVTVARRRRTIDRPSTPLPSSQS